MSERTKKVLLVIGATIILGSGLALPFILGDRAARIYAPMSQHDR